jgi:hypothetical protein
MPEPKPERMPGPVVIVGAPTALGGDLAGMDRTAAELRRRGVVGRPASIADSRVAGRTR